VPGEGRGEISKGTGLRIQEFHSELLAEPAKRRGREKRGGKETKERSSPIPILRRISLIPFPARMETEKRKGRILSLDRRKGPSIYYCPTPQGKGTVHSKKGERKGRKGNSGSSPRRAEKEKLRALTPTRSVRVIHQNRERKRKQRETPFAGGGGGTGVTIYFYQKRDLPRRGGEKEKKITCGR